MLKATEKELLGDTRFEGVLQGVMSFHTHVLGLRGTGKGGSCGVCGIEDKVSAIQLYLRIYAEQCPH